jgi:hypothetical protein
MTHHTTLDKKLKPPRTMPSQTTAKRNASSSTFAPSLLRGMEKETKESVTIGLLEMKLSSISSLNRLNHFDQESIMDEYKTFNFWIGAIILCAGMSMHCVHISIFELNVLLGVIYPLLYKWRRKDRRGPVNRHA